MAEARHFLSSIRSPKTGFDSRMGAVEGGVHCCVFCDRGVQGWAKLEADSTMQKGCESMLQNSTLGYVNMSGGQTKCRTIN